MQVKKWFGSDARKPALCRLIGLIEGRGGGGGVLITHPSGDEFFNLLE